jgi:pimeloyl-ACP methyl ester carboxylesterase
MLKLIIKIFFTLGMVYFMNQSFATGEPLWLNLPPTPSLPKAGTSGYIAVDGVKIWYATFGKGRPVILLHGGLANSNYWANQVNALLPNYKVIVMDSRGHGRSTIDNQPFSYDLMTKDVVGVMDALRIDKAAIVGWSDGAIIGLDMAINYPNRVVCLFAFAANSDPSGVKDVNKSPVFTAFIKRAGIEYERLSATPNQYDKFVAQISKMWATQPYFTKEQLNGIKTKTWIVDADHDEAIKRENTLYMAGQINNSGLLIQPEVSHFSFIQNPTQFNNNLKVFLSRNYN